MNTELLRFYLGMSNTCTDLMPKTNYTDIKKALDVYFNGCWTWELINESSIVCSNTAKIVTVIALYTPGKVYTGRSVCNSISAEDNHLRALADAASSFMADKQQDAPVHNSQPPVNNNNNGMQQMSADQINNMLNNANNSQQASPQPANQSQPSQQQDAFGQNMNPPVNPNNNGQQNIGQPQPRTFTPEQIAAVNAFKADADIQNDEQFGKWVNTWNPLFTSKKDLTPDNVDAFLQWYKQMGES